MSDYAAFYVFMENESGVNAPVPMTDVIISDDEGTELDVVTTDGDGRIVAGTVSVDAGSRIRFRVENYFGLAGSVSQITT